MPMGDVALEETYASVSSKYIYWDRSSALSTYQIERALFYGDIGSASFMREMTPHTVGSVSIPSHSSIDRMKRDMVTINITTIEEYHPIVIEAMYEWWSIHDHRIISAMINDNTLSIERRMAIAYAIGYTIDM